MNWIKIYKECKEMGGNHFTINMGIPHGSHVTELKKMTLPEIQNLAFAQMEKTFDVFTLDDIEKILRGFYELERFGGVDKALKEKVEKRRDLLIQQKYH